MPEPAKPTLHLVKLCVGADSVEDQLNWQARHSANSSEPVLSGQFLLSATPPL